MYTTGVLTPDFVSITPVSKRISPFRAGRRPQPSSIMIGLMSSIVGFGFEAKFGDSSGHKTSPRLRMSSVVSGRAFGYQSSSTFVPPTMIYRINQNDARYTGNKFSHTSPLRLGMMYVHKPSRLLCVLPNFIHGALRRTVCPRMG